MVGLNDLEGLFQLKWFYDSMCFVFIQKEDSKNGVLRQKGLCLGLQSHVLEETHDSYIILVISKFLPKYTNAGDAKELLTYQIHLLPGRDVTSRRHPLPAHTKWELIRTIYAVRMHIYICIHVQPHRLTPTDTVSTHTDRGSTNGLILFPLFDWAG